nr:GNAT family N-acetyltransferase [uncultured Oscillibacter sp.]
MTAFTLRPWRPSDAADVASAANNPKIAANLRNVFPSPYTLADAEWYVGDCIAQGEERQLTRAIVIEDRAAGSIGVFVKDDVYEKSAELGYWLAEEHWGRGVMTEAVRQLCREAFRRFDILRIYAEPFSDNLGSRRVLEKAGFTCEGTMRNGVYKNGRVHSYCMYALLREELG